MSISVTIIFYSTEKPAEPQETIRRLIEWSGATTYGSAFRTAEEDRSWAEFQAEREKALEEEEEEGEEEALEGAEAEEAEVPEALEVPVFFDEPEEEVFRPPQAPIATLPQLYRDGGNLRIELRACPVAKSLKAAIERGIPRDVRGDYLPHELSLHCGFHDIFECEEHSEGLYIARAFFSVRLFSYSPPWQAENFKKLFSNLPEVDQLRGQLRGIIGPVGEFMEWSY